METLKKSKEFKLIYNYGKKSYGYYSLVFFKKTKNKNNRMGFVVSKKIGNAVCRNRIRRLFREYYRENQERIKKGYEIIFVGKKNAGNVYKNLKYPEMKKDIDKIFKKSNLFTY
ncbi:MAG: ribonuclease P protein component [Fusobacterium sp. JB020]|nr:ribonuclease P protein component [Fusobacterium sp. JB020]